MLLLAVAGPAAGAAASAHPRRTTAVLESRRALQQQQQQQPGGPAPEAFGECLSNYARLGLQGILGMLPSCSDDPLTEPQCCGQIRAVVNQPGAAFYLCGSPARWLLGCGSQHCIHHAVPGALGLDHPATLSVASCWQRNPNHPLPPAGLCDAQAYELVRNNIGSARLRVPVTTANFDYWLGRCHITAISTSGCPAAG
jgi:hypothetical protein